MVSVRQLQAFVWTVRLKTLSRAADKLNMSQPAISKRIQELEASCGFGVFVKLGRSVALTPRGKILYEHGENVLAILEQIDALRDEQDVPPQRIGIGVTELVAHTWLPRLVSHVGETFPSIELTVAISQSAGLLDRLLTGELDLIVRPSRLPDASLTEVPLGDVAFALMASPRLCDGERIHDGAELAAYRLLTHGPRTGGVTRLDLWRHEIGLHPAQTSELDSLAGQVGMAIAGMGLTLMPKACFRFLLDSGQLIEVRTQLPPPRIAYSVLCRRHDQSGIVARMARAIAEVADFTQGYQS